MIGSLVVLIALPPAALSVGSFFGGRHWILDLASSFRPQYAGMLAVTACLAALLGRRRSAAILTGIALVNLAWVAPLMIPTSNLESNKSDLKVMYHNVHGGGDDRFALMAEYLATSDADLVFLSEVSARWIELFSRADLPYTPVYPLRTADHRRIMALSRIPVTSAGPVPLTEGARTGGIAVDVLLDGHPVRIMAVHTTSPRTAHSHELRNRELAATGRWAARQELPAIVIGDLNVSPWSTPFRTLEQESGLRNSQRGFGLQPTWMAGTGPLMIPIDHALHDHSLEVINRETGPPLGSAHHSLTVEFTWRLDVSRTQQNRLPAGKR